MRSKNLILFSLCLASLTTKAQKDSVDPYTLGSNAPKLEVKEWLKGSQPESFEKNKVHVVEFWATWCSPCIGNMPHLSDLAHQYKDSVTFSAIDVYESHLASPKTPAQLKQFVDKMGDKMDFNVGIEDANTAHDWLDAYQKYRIPTTFVIDKKGRVAWIGHPMELDTVLPKVLNGTWDIEQELAKIKHETYLTNLDTSLMSKVLPFEKKSVNLGDLGLPDSILNTVDRMIKQEPELKYMPTMVKYSFSALLKTDPKKAYEFGQSAIELARYKETVRLIIIEDIRNDMKKFTTPKEIFLLGAKCFQENIEISSHASDDYLATKYNEMSDWYRRGGDKRSANAALEKALEYYKRDLQSDESKVEASRLLGAVPRATN